MHVPIRNKILPWCPLGFPKEQLLVSCIQLSFSARGCSASLRELLMWNQCLAPCPLTPIAPALIRSLHISVEIDENMVSNLRPALASERLSTDFTSNTVRSFKKRQSSSTLRRPLQSSRLSSCRRKAQSGNHQLHFTKAPPETISRSRGRSTEHFFQTTAANQAYRQHTMNHPKWPVFLASTLNKILPKPSGWYHRRYSGMNVDLVERLREQFFSGLLHPKNDRFLLHDITTYSIHPVHH